MRKRGLSFILSLTALTLIAAGGSADQKTQWKGKIKIENGETVVRNPVAPAPKPGGPSKVILIEDLVIGRETTEKVYLFAELRSVGVDDEERIWALDWEDIKVRIFDKRGKLLNTFGKKGEGPQELQNPSRMVVKKEGVAAILGLNKLAFYAADGRCLKELSTARSRMARYRFDTRGYIYADSLDLGAKWHMSILRYDPELKLLGTMASYEEPFQPGQMNAFTALVLFHVTKNDYLAWVATPRYEIDLVDLDGRLVRKILKDYKRIRVTDEAKKRILKERWGDRAPSLKIVFPEEFPPMDVFLADDEDRFYVRTYETDEHGARWHDVFDPEGRCFTRFVLPEDEMAFIVKKDKLYTLIQEDEEGRPLIKRYALTWR
jgi:hypothetical protein